MLPGGRAERHKHTAIIIFRQKITEKIQMKWKKYTIYTTTEAEDLVSLMLNEAGVEGVQIEDNVPLSDTDTKGMFIDILPELPPDDGSSRLSFFLRLADDSEEQGNVKVADAEGTAEATVNSAAIDDDFADKSEASASKESEISDVTVAACTDTCVESCADSAKSEDRSYSIEDKIWSEDEIKALLETVRAELDEMRSYTDIGEGRIVEGVTEDTDWRDNWKQFFKPIKVDDFLIKPTWEDIPSELKAEAESGELKVIEIDPGTAFGTGSHETTQLCMAALKDYIKPGDTVLDIGTGSGILGIGAIKLGADKVAATELDEMCKPSIMDNISYNDIGEDSFRLFIGNVIGDEATISAVREQAPSGYDVVIANILAPVIAMLAEAGNVDALIKQGGIFITSGIIDTKLDEVRAAFEANPAWELLKVNAKGEWTSIIAKRV